LWSCDNSLHGFSPRLTTHFRRVAVGSDPEKVILRAGFPLLIDASGISGVVGQQTERAFSGRTLGKLLLCH
jgi:hypothetical protein